MPSRRLRRDRMGIDHFAGIHLAQRIPDRLELAERLHQFFAEHFRQQLRPGLPVAMLAGERAAVSHDQIGGLVQEGPPFSDALGWCTGRSRSGNGCSPGRNARRATDCSRTCRTARADRADSCRPGRAGRRNLPSRATCRAAPARTRWRRGRFRALPTAFSLLRRRRTVSWPAGSMGLQLRHALAGPGRRSRPCRRRRTRRAKTPYLRAATSRSPVSAPFF